MAGIISVSRTNLEGRRQRLRRRRQMRILQSIWRTLAISSLASGLLWMAIQPIWVLTDPHEITIFGNQLLSDKAIQSRLKLSYPQSLWRIQPAKIAQALQQQPTIAQATVTRRLFPPGLIVHIKERVPVAVTIGESKSSDADTANSSSVNTQQHEHESKVNTRHKKTTVGLLDASGVWMPLEKHVLRNSAVKLPSLKVIGLPEQYRLYWAQLYQALSQSSVKVTEIDWQDPTNLILKTEIGKVLIGTPSLQISEQIRVMTQMRHLPTQLNPSQIEYIDLKNPEYPLVQMNQKKQPIKPQIP